MGDFDRFADDYDSALGRGLAVSGEDKEYFAEGRVRWLAQHVGPLGPGTRILDFGCGTGTAAPFLARSFDAATIVGMDVSEGSLAVARRAHGDVARFVTLDSLPVEAPFDLVYCNGVFHHIPPAGRDAVCRSIFAAIRPGGWFSLWENNPYNPGTRWVMSRIEFDRDAVLLSPRETRAMANAAGFAVVRTDFLFVFPKLLAALRALEGPLSRLPLGGQYQVLLRRPAA